MVQYQRKKVYATIISTDSYLPGVIKLYRSLRLVKSNYDFICVCSVNISDNTIKEMESNNINCLRLKECACKKTTMNFSKEFGHWKYTFDKILLFGLTQFEKIVYLDSDMIVLENIDNLFEYKSFSAVAAGKLAHPEWNRLNSGTLVIEPDVGAMTSMLNLIDKVYKQRSSEGLMTGDQDIINEYKQEWINSKELIIPESYNLFFKYISLYHKKNGFSYNNKDDAKSIKVVHFVGNKKPWHLNLIQKIGLLIKYSLTFDYKYFAFAKYLQI